MLFAAFGLLTAAEPLHADTPRFELDEVVVTATREEETLRDIPRNVTVITAEDIEQATSANVVDLLSREAGITLQSLGGSDKNSTIDIRGMGASAANNVIVVVDGVRQNSSDLSGTDFSSIALDQIERIEILRGAGGVVYGDGAVGGVINIVTKKAGGAPERRIYISYGSYGTVDTRASLKDTVRAVGITMNAGYYDSGGYRDNGQLTKKDIAVRLDADNLSWGALWLTGSYHQDDYGLPGPVPLADMDSETARTGTRTPDDGGETTDQRVGAGMRMESQTWGTLTAALGYRFRENPYVLGYSPLLDRDDQTSEITEDTRTVDVRYIKEYTLFHLPHQVQVGLDHFSTRYVREELPGGPRENSAVDNLGLYVTNRWSLAEPLALNWGYRQNRFDGIFRTDSYTTFGSVRRWVNGQESDRDWTNDAYEIGLNYQLNPDVALFSSYSTSFRVPNVDELAEAEPGLKPQEGTHIDVGARFNLGETVEWSITGYQVRIEDELYYSEVNRNYDEPTVRRGIETDIKWYPTLRHFLWANYTYTSARFEDSDRQVPLVPEHKIDAGLEWQAAEPLLLALGATFVGPRFDGNDIFNNRFKKLDAYTVVDIKITWTRGPMKLFAGINNLLDERYATTAYSESNYPMPERNFYGGLQWRF